MSQSLAKVYTHLIFSTKHRERCLTDDLRADLHAYMGGTLNGMGCSPIEINSEPEHVHALFLLGRSIALSDVIGNLKKASNDWLRDRDAWFARFYWQGGYGAFSVSQSGVEEVRQYIRGQKEHHKQMSYQDEFRAFLRRYEIEFDERETNGAERTAQCSTIMHRGGTLAPLQGAWLISFDPRASACRPQPWARFLWPVGPPTPEP